LNGPRPPKTWYSLYLIAGCLCPGALALFAGAFDHDNKDFRRVSSVHFKFRYVGHSRQAAEIKAARCACVIQICARILVGTALSLVEGSLSSSLEMVSTFHIKVVNRHRMDSKTLHDKLNECVTPQFALLILINRSPTFEHISNISSQSKQPISNTVISTVQRTQIKVFVLSWASAVARIFIRPIKIINSQKMQVQRYDVIMYRIIL